MRKFAFSVFALACLAAPQSASARDFLAYQSTTPLLYRYAACALAQEEPTAEEQLDRCKETREFLEEQADSILLKFHSADRRRAQINLKKGFQEIDRDAKRAREQRKTAPPSILAYLECMGESVMETEDYKNGTAVDYIEIEDNCASEHILSVTSVSSEAELERLRILYRRFARVGRYVDNASRLGAGIASTGDRANARLSRPGLSRAPVEQPFFVIMEGSFLNLSRLPADS